MEPYFIWKDINSLDMDIIVNKLPPISKPEKNIERKEIRGRDGFLTQDDKTYKPIIKSVECTVINGDIDKICAWLDGIGEIIFSDESDRIYKAVIINQIPFSKVIPIVREFIVQFECQPFKYCKEGCEIITITKQTDIYNPGTYYSKPYMKIYSGGNFTLFINNKKVVIKGCEQYIELDSEIEEAWKGSINCNNKMYSEFPTLDINKNIITWTGDITKIEIMPRWRFL